MNWDDAFKLASSIFVSIGGGSVIIFSLSSWLGKIWAERILSADRNHYQKQMESLKHDYQRQMEVFRSDVALKLEIAKRFSENQFRLYNELWRSLCDLKAAGDSLWERVDIPSVKKFAKQLADTKREIRRNSLLIERQHYTRLQDLIEQFDKFKFGKTQLADLRKHSRTERDQPSSFNEYDIQNTIEHNREAKERYSELLDELEDFFRNQIQGME